MIGLLNSAMRSMFATQVVATNTIDQYVSRHGVPSAALFSQLFVRALYTTPVMYDSSWWVYNIHTTASKHRVPTIYICRPWPADESFDIYLNAIAGIAVIVSSIFGRSAGMSSGEISKYAHANWRNVARLLRNHMSDVRQILYDDPEQYIVGTAGINHLLEKMTLD